MAAKVSLRDKHTAATHQRIVDEALALFIEQGYDATTVDEIAEHANISPRTFFRYFPTKEAVLFHDFEARLEKLHEMIVRRPVSESPALTFIAVLVQMVADLNSTPEERLLMMRLLTERPSLRSYQRTTIVEVTEKQLTGLLAERAGLPPHHLGVRAMVAAVAACFDVALKDWIEAGAGSSFDELFTTTLTACIESFPSLPIELSSAS